MVYSPRSRECLAYSAFYARIRRLISTRRASIRGIPRGYFDALAVRGKADPAMADRKRSFASVMIIQLPEDFKPQRPWNMPPSFSGGELYATQLTHSGATRFANTFNKRQLQDGLPDRRWAIAVMSVRKPGRVTMLEAFEQHERNMSVAFAWWDSLSTDERLAAQKAAGVPNPSIFHSYRAAKRQGIAAEFEKQKIDALRREIVAWWDALSDDERDRALAAVGGKKNSIAKAYRFAHGLIVLHASDEADERPSNDVA